MRRIGLYGGTFDPVHNAHLALAKLARDHLRLDELRLVPSGVPWQKQSRVLTPAADRLAMLTLAVADEPRFVIESCELQRAGPSYSIDTVRELQAAEAAPAEWFLVIGQDQYAHFSSWHEWQALLHLTTLAVAGRAGHEPRAPDDVAALPHRIVTLPLPAMAVSSSEVRERLARGAGIADLVPPAVARYIDLNHLYRN
jgi:nicotinate-nucleotide adenylyltransferase